jgi:CheY-like chemotaxis protein
MSSSSKLYVLLVEDDDVASEAVVRGLQKHASHCTVVPAEDGSSALRILRGQDAERQIARPFLVLLDLNMPRMSGIEFLRELRADPELCSTVVFVLTTSGTDADKASAYQQNVAGYMVKSAVGPQFSALARFLNEYRNTVSLP